MLSIELSMGVISLWEVSEITITQRGIDNIGTDTVSDFGSPGPEILFHKLLRTNPFRVN